MARKPRLFIPGLAAHVVQRGHCRGDVFHDQHDFEWYLGMLGEACEQHGCALHAYVLMNNHVHLLVTPEAAESVSEMMQALGRRFVPIMNKKYERSGSLWEGRFKACLVDNERYLLACYRYIELNPVRAAMVSRPDEYRWSSFRCNGMLRYQ